MSRRNQGQTGKRGEAPGILPLTDGHLLRLSDCGLVRLIASYIEVTVPGVKPAYHLASILGCHRRTIQNILNGKAHPSIEQLQRLADEYPIARRWVAVKFNLNIR